MTVVSVVSVYNINLFVDIAVLSQSPHYRTLINLSSSYT